MRLAAAHLNGRARPQLKGDAEAKPREPVRRIRLKSARVGCFVKVMKLPCPAVTVLGPHGHVASTIVEEIGGDGEVCMVGADVLAIAHAKCAKHAFRLSRRRTMAILVSLIVCAVTCMDSEINC